MDRWFKGKGEGKGRGKREGGFESGTNNSQQMRKNDPPLSVCVSALYYNNSRNKSRMRRKGRRGDGAREGESER